MLSRAFIKGEERELLIPSLFIAKDKGWKAEISDTNNLIEILEAYYYPLRYITLGERDNMMKI